MTRIYSTLASVATLLLAANFLLGMSIGDYQGHARQLLAARQQVDRQQSRGGEPGRLAAARRELAAQSARFTPVRQRATLHKLLGIASVLVAMLVHSISVTYFIGTARWCKEVVTRYDLPASLAAASESLKRRSFPWSLAGILAVLVIAALGGAADPGANLGSAARWVTPHLVAALVGMLLSAGSYLAQVGFIRENLQVIDQILGQVARIRREQGWDAGAP